MGSPVPVQIGSYCADFIIVDPDPLEGPYYFRRIDAENRKFYLTIDNSGNYVEIESPIEITASTIYNTNEHFQIKLHWDKFLKILVENGNVTPSNKMRYLSSLKFPNPNTNNVAFFSSNKIKVRSNSSSGLTSYSTTSTQTFVTYDIVQDAPDSVTRSSLMYLVNDADDNNNVIKPSTRMRYLIVDPTNKPPTVSELNLFLPRVTEAMVKLTMYRFNKRTNLGSQSTVSYSFDVFRSSSYGVAPTTSSTLRYFDINSGLISNLYFDNADGDIIENTTGIIQKGTNIKYVLSDGSTVRYTATDMVFDKSISDLYGDFSLGLFKIVDASGNDTGRYLGYDCTTINTTGTCSTAKQIIAKDYNLFRKPSYSCQFRLYDLGNNEYMIYVTDPDDINSRLVLKPDSTGAITYTKTTAIKEERGWHLEQINSSKNTVRIKWNYPESPVAATTPTGKNYLLIDSNTNTAVMGSTTETGKTSVYICIRCSIVDPATGTCSTSNMVYVDDDLNYATPPVIMSPLAINAGQAPVFVDSNMRILDGSNALEVSEDGIVSYKSSSTQRFFTTQTGVLTTTEKNILRIIFLGKQTSTGEYMYAKYTAGQDVKFVVATNPNPADGFGWTITVNPSNPSQSEIKLYQPGSPTPIYLKNGVRYMTVERNFSATLGSYDPETNQYNVNFLWNVGASLVEQSTSPSSGFTDVGSTTSITVNATPIRIIYFRGTTDSGDTIVSALSIPDVPAPVIASGFSLGNPTSTTFDFQNINVSNMNSSGTMQITAMSPSLPSTTTYTYNSTITVTGLTPLTTYSGIGIRFTNTINNKTASITLASTIRTTAASSFTFSSTFYMRSGSDYIKYNGTNYGATTVFVASPGTTKAQAVAFKLVTTPTPNLVTSGFSVYKITNNAGTDISSRADTYLRTYGRGANGDMNIYLYAQSTNDINNQSTIGSNPALTGGEQYSFKFTNVSGNNYRIEIPGNRYLRILPTPGSYHSSQYIIAATTNLSDATTFTLEN